MMERFSDIAKDYLADFDVLTEARRDFEKVLGAWWSEILEKGIKPVLVEENGGPANVWDNQNNPGMAHCRAIEDQEVLLEVTDPRASDRPFYSVSLYAQSHPVRKMLGNDDVMRNRLEGIARKEKLGGSGALNWKSTQLATVDLPVLADDPDAMLGQVRDTVRSFFRIVVEHRTATKSAK